MVQQSESESRKLLSRLQAVMAEAVEGQERLNRITHLIADSMGTEVCSIYLLRDADTLELCATEGLAPEAVHVTRMRIGEGLVGRVARNARPVNTANAPGERGFRYMPETGEERYSSFLGVPIMRLGERLGVLVVQSKEAREFSGDEIYALEVVAMVVAEMAELGAFTGEGAALRERHTAQEMFRGGCAQEGTAMGMSGCMSRAWWSRGPWPTTRRWSWSGCNEAVERLRVDVDQMLTRVSPGDAEQREVLEAYRMFARSRGWMRRMEEDIARGLSAEAAVEKEQSTARARMETVPDAYLRDRLHDLDDLSNRLLRLLTGQGQDTGAELPPDPILVARNIGPAELLDYGRRLKGVVLEEGSVGSHAAIVARALAIPLVINAARITTEALNGDFILVDGDQGIVHLRPEDTVASAFRDKLAMQAEAQERYASIRDKPAEALCGTVVSLQMNAGLMADLPSLPSSGAEGVGLFRTELQFLTRNKVPRRGELAALYARVMDAAGGKKVVFRTLDIGSDKVLPYMKPTGRAEPGAGLAGDPGGARQAGRDADAAAGADPGGGGAAAGVMFPFIAQLDEFTQARDHLLREARPRGAWAMSCRRGPEIGAMLETPSMAFAPRKFYEMADFISIGGNDLKQFFYAADRENERVRRRYDTLNVSFLSLIEQIVAALRGYGHAAEFLRRGCRAADRGGVFRGHGAQDAVDAAGFHRAGEVAFRRVNLDEARAVIDEARESGAQSVRPVR
jgi:phosphotransferase system enzyme I (PtsP)